MFFNQKIKQKKLKTNRGGFQMKRFIMNVFVAVSVVAMLSVLGCAGMGKGPSDEELIRATIDKVKTALETKNIDLLMTTFGDDFEHPEANELSWRIVRFYCGLESSEILIDDVLQALNILDNGAKNQQ